MSVTSGFYIPQNLAKGYVLNQTNQDGSYKYDVDADGNIYSGKTALQAQKAIQNLNQTYSDTINNAYSQYLNSKHNINMSSMGEGYKQAYIQRQEQAFKDAQVQASMNAAEARQTLGETLNKADLAVNQQYQQEVNYMNTVAANLDKYLTYVEGLRKANEDGTYNPDGEGYLTDYQQGQTLESMYDILFNAQPVGYKTIDDKDGQNFLDWMRDQVKTPEDQEWFNWLSTGGYEQFKQGALQTYNDNFIKRENEVKVKHALDSTYTPQISSYVKNHDLGGTDWGKSFATKWDQGYQQDIDKYMESLNITEEDVNKYLKQNEVILNVGTYKANGINDGQEDVRVETLDKFYKYIKRDKQRFQSVNRYQQWLNDNLFALMRNVAKNKLEV